MPEARLTEAQAKAGSSKVAYKAKKYLYVRFEPGEGGEGSEGVCGLGEGVGEGDVLVVTKIVTTAELLYYLVPMIAAGISSCDRSGSGIRTPPVRLPSSRRTSTASCKSCKLDTLQKR
jgi:hypothetical protein